MLIILFALGLASLVFLFYLSFRKPKDSSIEIKSKLDTLEDAQQRFEQAVTNEFAKNRAEMNTAARNDRQELSTSITTAADSNAKRISEIGAAQKDQLDSFAKQLT